MGSWTELDANYPPGALTPAAALVVALGHYAGARAVRADGVLASFVPPGLGYAPDLIERVQRYLAEVPLETFFEHARAVLTPRQRLVVALQIVDRQLAAGDPPLRHAFVAQLIAGIGADLDALAAHRATLVLKNDLEIFPQ